jgi:lysophospholipase L1-like esterase
MRLKPLLVLVPLVAVLFAGWIWMNRSATQWPVKNHPQPADAVIVAMGDSLTEGFGATPDTSYPAHLSRLIGRRIINKGITGEETAEGLRRLDQDVLSHKPGIVLLCLGANDMLRKQPIEHQFRHLRLIIERIQETGAMVVLIGVQGIGPIGGSEYGEQYEKLARETGCVYVPNVMRGILFRPGHLSDPIHPNGEGYAEFARTVHKHAGEWLTP